MATATVTNGIDVGQLVGTIDAIKDDPSLGSFTFRARSTWKDGTYNVGEISTFQHAGNEDDSRSEPFRLEGDEPPVLLGNNRGPNAVELLLQALGYCYAVGFVANAAAKGIEVESMEYEIDGEATNAHTAEEGWFMIAGIDPDEPGCWEVEATYKGATLSYVYLRR